MTDFSIVHDFATDAQTFWRIFFDDAYNDEFYGSVGLARRVVDRSENDESLVVVAEFSSERQLPSFVQKLLGGRNLGYVETLTFRKGEQVAEQVVQPSVLSERVDFRGQISVDSVGPNLVRRTYRGTMQVSAPLIGGRIERATLGDMQRTHEQAAQVTRAWLAKTA